MKENRIEKYSKLREDIENLDSIQINKSKEARKKVKNQILKDSIQYASRHSSDNSIDMSIDTLLEGHSKYVKIDRQNDAKKDTKNTRLKNFLSIGICAIFVIVFIIVVVTLIRNGD